MPQSLPIANKRLLSLISKGRSSLSRFDTSANVLGSRASLSSRRLVPMACSISPNCFENASCSSAVSGCPLKTKRHIHPFRHELRSHFLLIAGFVKSIPVTSPANLSPTCLISTAIKELQKLVAKEL